METRAAGRPLAGGLVDDVVAPDWFLYGDEDNETHELAPSESSESEFQELDESSKSDRWPPPPRRLLRPATRSFHSAVGGRTLKRKTGPLLSCASRPDRPPPLQTMAEKAICRKDLCFLLFTRQDLMAVAVPVGGEVSIGGVVGADDDDCWTDIGRTTATLLCLFRMLADPLSSWTGLLICWTADPLLLDLCWTVTSGLLLTLEPASSPLLLYRRQRDQASASWRSPGEMTFWSSRTRDGNELTTNKT